MSFSEIICNKSNLIIGGRGMPTTFAFLEQTTSHQRHRRDPKYTNAAESAPAEEDSTDKQGPVT